MVPTISDSNYKIAHRNLFFSNFEILFLERTQWFLYWEIKSCKSLKKRYKRSINIAINSIIKPTPPSPPPQKISTYKTYRNSNFSRNIYEKKMTVDEISGIQFYYNSTSNVSPTIHTSWKFFAWATNIISPELVARKGNNFFPY